MTNHPNDAEKKRFLRIMEFQEDYVDEWVKSQMVQELPASQVVFHYTNGDALLGILSTECLWATAVRHLNDADEMLDGVRVLKQTLSKYESHNNPGIAVTARYMLHRYNPSDEFDIYTVSFCEDGDVANQWQNYAGNDGFAIGFNAAQFLNASAESYLFRKCRYSPEEKLQIIDGAVIESFRYLGALANDKHRLPLDLMEDWICERFFLATLQNLPFFKNHTFRNEKEWRIVLPVNSSNAGSISYRKSDDKSIPYCEFRMYSKTIDGEFFLPITSIISGPHASSEKIEEVRSALTQSGYGDIPIFRSECTLR